MIYEPCAAQSQEMQQLILNVEKLSQFRKILDDMKAGYETLVKGYNAVRDISQGNFNLHQVFLDGLLQVSPTVKKYYKVKLIIGDQITLTKEYKAAWKQFNSAQLFNENEKNYVRRVYDQLFDESIQSLDQLAMIITAGELRMSDEERLRAIDALASDTQEKLIFLRSFNGETAELLLHKQKLLNETRLIEKISIQPK